jgi:DNA-directed RNA polymerase I and III subunit RPAC2
MDIDDGAAAPHAPRQGGVGGALPDPAGATFAVEQEDHSLANALRFFLNKDPRVSFAGYSMPHPTEDVVNVRVQTTGE